MVEIIILWRNRGMTIKLKIGMLEGIVVLTVLYGLESWVLNARERMMVEVYEMKCLRKVFR